MALNQNAYSQNRKLKKIFSKKNAPKSLNNELGGDFGLWYAALISLALNHKLIAALSTLDVDKPANTHFTDDSDVYDDQWVQSSKSDQAIDDLMQVLVAEMHITPDPELA